MNTALFIALRRLRLPIIAVIVAYAISVTGLALIPGIDNNGQPVRMSWFHAFYVMSYTATTIGFGEIPYAFTDGQRMWVTCCIYLSVTVWAWLLAVIFALTQDKVFLGALVRARFIRQVQRLREPFWLMAGYGQTGALLCDRIGRRGQRMVVLDKREAEIFELELRDHGSTIPALLADARNADALMWAGLSHPALAGVLALTSDDATNLAVAAAAKVINPSVPVYCRLETPAIAESAVALGADVIINPFSAFSEELRLLLTAPDAQTLFTQLVPSHVSARLTRRLCRDGAWIICGYGRFGRLVGQVLTDAGRHFSTIDPGQDNATPGIDSTVWERELSALQSAHLADAAAIVVATGDDSRNLAIVALARHINPEIFVVLRQNDDDSAALFHALQPDMLMVHSRMVARQCLAQMISPLLPPFLAGLHRLPAADISRLLAGIGAQMASIRAVSIDPATTPALSARLARIDGRQALTPLLHDNRDRQQRLNLQVLALARAGLLTLAPDDRELTVQADDVLLLAGSPAALDRLALTLADEPALAYVLDGVNRPDGLIWRMLAARRQP